MKIALRLLSLLILLGVSLSYTGCKKDNEDPETTEKKQFDKLSGEWSLLTANDGSDRTEDFLTDDASQTPLVLHVQGTYVENGIYNYSFTGRRPDPSPWPVSGTWKFGTNKETQVIRDPGSTSEIPMEYTVSETNLTVSFTVPDGGGWEGGTSRIKNVVGDWTFSFEKK